MGKARRINKINDNERFLKKSSMINDINERKMCSEAEAEAGAQRYIRKLGAPECRLFFLKVMYWLPYNDRERLLEAATRPNVRSPKRYFTFCAKRALAKYGH